MASQLRREPSPAVQVRTCPPPPAIAEALERNAPLRGAVLQLCFGAQVAGLPIDDPWSACCELLLDAQLIREGRLDHFVLDVEQVFGLSYDGGAVLCIFSPEHVFAVSREELAASLEHVVEQIFAATTCPPLMRIAARWGASAIRALPYSCRFSDSALT